MKIVTARPPNFDQIAAVFKAALKPGVIFCYGETIFNPSGRPLSPALIIHESVHSHRQNGKPDAWWERYLVDADFRFEEELFAHQEEYGAVCKGLTRNQRRGELRQISRRLAGPLYGCMVTREKCARLIGKGADL